MIVVAGGPAQNEADRGADRVVPAQALVDGSFVALDGLVPTPGRGVSNLAVVGRSVWWSDGTDLRVVGDGPVAIEDLDDVHELSVDGDRLFVANTASDECLTIDTSTRSLTSRQRVGHGVLHLNQVFRSLGGEQFGLVHHVHGRQLTKRIAGRVLKMQGDGGVVNLQTGEPVALRLTAPHSARVVGEELWIADSGRARIVRYDAAWNEIASFPTAGWGRGVAVVDGHYWLGLSPLRPRYRNFVQGRAVETPEVHVFDIATQQLVDRYRLSGVDQINGIHDVPAELFDSIVGDRR